MFQPEQATDGGEAEYEALGVGRALESLWASINRKRLSDSKVGQSLLHMALPPLTEAVQKEQDRIKAGARPRYWQEFVALKADTLAYLTILTILDGYRGSKEDEKLTKYTMLAKRVGDWVKLEHRVNQEPEAERIRRWVAAGHDKNASRAAKRYKPFSKIGWTARRLSIQLGGALLSLAVAHGAELFRLYEKTGQPHRVRLTRKGHLVLRRRREDEERAIRPKWLPMTAPPRPWIGNDGGGYDQFAMPLVKCDDEPKMMEIFKKADLAPVADAVNALQETPWRINRKVAAVFEEVYRQKGPASLLPYIEMPKMPRRLPKKTTPEAEYLKRRRERRRVWKLRNMAASNLLALDTRIAILKKLGARTIYFPHQADTRGRIYPIPQEIHPQAEDMSRALIEFARGKPLGEQGAFWLAVQLANLYGHKIDKLPLEKRVDWVRQNSAKIVESAQRPLDGEMLWATAEKKWRFLAACFEWAGYIAEGPNYVSHLPIAMDGTCNGSQHLSALKRDPVGGGWTNLVPSPEPRDLYQEVANHLQAIVDADAANGEPLAVLWKPCIKRGLVKQATMTTPYGVTLSGMKQQLRGVILEDEDYRNRFPDEKAAAAYLAPKVNKAIGQVVIGAAEVRAWLRKLVKKLARKDRPLSWTVPTGFPVLHEYRKEENKRVPTVRGNVLVKLENPRFKIRTRKQVNSIVPNLIHSLDAAHMMRTVIALKAAGLSDFAMVHDSYAVHACDVDVMNRVLREEFVRLHNEFTLASFYEQVKAGSPAIRFTKKSTPPALGVLDLAAVKDAVYFFS